MQKHSAIRRWVSPIAGEIEITGTLGHPADHGDGVRGWIISSRQGVLKEWTVKHDNARPSIDSLARATRRDDRLRRRLPERRMIATDSPGLPSSKRNKSPARPPAVVQLWHSANDFSGPPLRA